MLEKWLALCSRLAITRAKTVLSIAAIITLLSGLSLLRLERDPSPESLLASANNDLREAQQAFRARFGSSEDVIVALLSHPDGVLTQEMLGYVYTLTEFARQLPHVARVDSLTTTPFRQVEAAEEALDEVTLDDLDEPAEDPLADDPELLSALSDVVAAAPEHFPMGLVSLSERMGGAKFAPLITSAEPDASEVRALAEAVDDAPLLRGRLIGKRGRDTLVVIELARTADRDERRARVGATLDALEGFLEAHPVPAPGGVHLGGLPVVASTIAEHMRRDQLVLVPATLLVSLLLMMASLRWWAGVLLPLVQVGVTSIVVLGGMALFGIRLTVISNILPVLLIILGLSDSIHLVHRYMEELEHSGDRDQSLRNTVRAIGRACLGTASTTSAGMFALGFCQTRMLAEFGILAGCGVIVAYFSTLLLLPALLKGRAPPPRVRVKKQTGESRLTKALVGWTIGFVRRPGLTVGAALLITAGAFAVGSNIRVDSALLDQFRRSDEIYQTTTILEREFEGVRTLEVSFESAQAERFFAPEVLRAVDRVAAWARAEKGVLSTFTAVDLFENTWASLVGAAEPGNALRSAEQVEGLVHLLKKQPQARLDSVLSEDGRQARLRIKVADIGSRATLALTARLQAELAAELAATPDVRATLLGDAYTTSRGLDAVVSDLTGSLGAALLTVFALMVISFRSFRYGLLTLPPGFLPLVLTLGWMAARDIPLNAATAIIFSVSIGITVDGSIHMLVRLREELSRSALFLPALLKTVRGTGEALLVACGALLAGFSVLLLSNFVPVQRFAELIAVSIASCVFTTLVVLPALLKLVGKRFLMRA